MKITATITLTQDQIADIIGEYIVRRGFTQPLELKFRSTRIYDHDDTASDEVSCSFDIDFEME